MKSKNALFMYIAISSGHQRAAEALMSALQRMNPRVACHGVDSFTHAYPVVGRLVARLYLELLKYTPQIWDYLWDNPSVMAATREIREVLSAFSTRKMLRLMKKFHPRVLVCTQAAPLNVLANLKNRGRIRVPLVGVVTDYDAHSYWLSRHVDLYLVATEEIKRKLVREGVKEGRVRVTGIPVDAHFAETGDKAAERLRLGLDAGKPVVLVMGGSKGLGPLEETVSALRRAVDAQVLAVCGQNGGARARLQRRFADDPAVRVYGFTKNLHRLMDAADLLVSKPGGLTCAEALAKGLPFVMIDPLPGQEERNADYMLRHGAAVRAGSLEELVEAAAGLLNDPARLERLRERMLMTARPDAAESAAEAVLSLMQEPAVRAPAERRSGAAAPRLDRPAAVGGAA